jgi:hypothetical protein
MPKSVNRFSGLDASHLIIIHLLGLAPAGCLVAPDNGPLAGYRGGCDGCAKKPARRKKDHNSGFGRVAKCHTRIRLP